MTIMYDKVSKEQKKHYKEKQEKIGTVLSEIMDILQRHEVSLSDMSNVFINLQANYNAMILEELTKLKK